MKKVLLLRHAKSSWEYSVEDRNRPLLEKGIRRIQAVANQSKEVFSDVEMFYSSSANRALHTATLVLHQLQLPMERLRVVEEVYRFDSAPLLTLIRELPDSQSSVCLVGHNPALSVLAAELSQNLIQHLPTAAWVKLIFVQNEWQAIQNGQAEWGFPKQLLK
ncbi:MAG: SixA phosphatase family protein [Flavobacteriaceae bacterium]